MKALLLLSLAPLACAQFKLSSVNGSTETPVASTFQFANAAAGANEDVRFRIRPSGNAAVTITTISLSGAGFRILAVNGTLPYTIAPSNALDFTIRFNAAFPARYNANLQIDELSVILLATAVTPPTVTALTGCTVSAQNAFDFGNVQIGSQHLCNFSLFNPTGQPMTISTIALTSPFTFQQPPSTPLTLPPNGATAFAVVIAPACGASTISGTLTIDSLSVPLVAAAITAPLAKPSFNFDTNRILSGEQHSLSVTLPSPSFCGATGNLNLTFVPGSNLPADASVVFVAHNTTSLPYTVAAGTAQVSISGQPIAIFATGSTAGSIVFSLTGTGTSPDPSSVVVIPPAPISIDAATASNQRLGDLDISVTAFDNTYSAGSMSFSFFDASGNQIGAAITADFSAQFRTYFASQTAGSAFLMRVSFPVEGNQSQVATVSATLRNSAGQVQTGTLTFK